MNNKTQPTKEELQQWYGVENLSAKIIANKTGYNKSRIFYFLDLYGIPRNKRDVIEQEIETRNVPDRPFEIIQASEGSTYRKIPGKEWLTKRYWEDNQNVTDIAQELGVNPNSVTKALHKHDIPIKPKYLCYVGRSHRLPDDFSVSLRTRIFERDNFSCLLCRAANSLEIHHIVPLRFGGKTVIENGATVCSACHSTMGSSELNYVNQLLQIIYSKE